MKFLTILALTCFLYGNSQANILTDAANSVKNAADNAVDSVKSAADNAVSSVKSAAENVVSSVKSATDNAVTSVTDTSDSAVEAASSKLKEILKSNTFAGIYCLFKTSSEWVLETVKEVIQCVFDDFSPLKIILGVLGFPGNAMSCALRMSPSRALSLLNVATKVGSCVDNSKQ